MSDSMDLMTHAAQNFCRSYIEEFGMLGYLACRIYDYGYPQLRRGYGANVEKSVSLFHPIVEKYVNLQKQINALKHVISQAVTRE